MGRYWKTQHAKQVKQAKLPHPASHIVQPSAVSLRHACTAGSTHCNTLLTVHDELPGGPVTEKMVRRADVLNKQGYRNQQVSSAYTDTAVA
jgi:hypothetical protein